jgi:hypothetical protein
VTSYPNCSVRTENPGRDVRVTLRENPGESVAIADHFGFPAGSYARNRLAQHRLCVAFPHQLFGLTVLAFDVSGILG